MKALNLNQVSSRFIKSRRSEEKELSQPSHAEIRRAKDFWTDIFSDSILAQIDESSAGRGAPEDMVRFSGRLADLALEEMEERWKKI